MVRWGAPVRQAATATVDIDLREALAVCRRDPVGSVLATARIESALADGTVRGGHQLWGLRRRGELVAVAWAGANLVPVCEPDDTEAVDAFAELARRQGRRCSSIVGDAAVVLPLWQRLEHAWGPAREVRPDQPSLVIDHAPVVPPDPQVRPTRPDELDVVLPACVAMFVEEVGYSPVEGSGAAYEARVRSLIDAGRSYARIEQGRDGPRVLFKAELGAVGLGVAQVQGVWVPPDRRGEGLSVTGMAAVVDLARRHHRTVSLYVNDYNARALATYRHVGFRQVGTYATVLF